MRYSYDEEHRLTEQHFPSGRCVHYRYDSRGRCVQSWIDYDGAPDPALADSVPALLADGVTKAKGMLHVRLEYDEGTTTVIDSRQTRRFDLNALGTIDLASGEVHTLTRDVAGRVVAETFFDGRRYEYKLDPAGRHLVHRNGAGERTAIEHDAAGRVIKRTYDDSSEESFEYDHEGRLVASQAGDVTTAYAYDARGYLVAETSSVAGAALPVEYVVDAAGQTVERRSAAGGVVRFYRDLMGRTTRVHLPDGGVIERTLDGLGREVLRSLPEGGSIVCRYDGMGALQERRVLSPRAARRGAPAEGSATTPLRFLGQYFDEDTGLSYNRHRYYDPALGLVINADPSGLGGGTGAFEYARSQARESRARRRWTPTSWESSLSSPGRSA